MTIAVKYDTLNNDSYNLKIKLNKIDLSNETTAPSSTYLSLTEYIFPKHVVEQ